MEGLNEKEKKVVVEARLKDRDMLETGRMMGNDGNWASGVLFHAKKKMRRRHDDSDTDLSGYYGRAA